MAERLANLGYLGLIAEATPGVPLTPTDFVPYYKETLTTSLNLVEDNPIAGNKFVRQAVIQGLRDHRGDFEVMAEPNTAARFFDMLLTKGSSSGTGPYTWPFTLGAAAKSYTVDISSGNQVFRFWGVQASKIAPAWDKTEMHLAVTISALGSFMGRTIATVATTTLTLDTTYDPAPNKGLVVGDLVRIYKSTTGATLDTTIATVNADGITVTLGASAAAFAPGDMISLRPATQTYNNLTPFIWPKMQFCFGATASARSVRRSDPLGRRFNLGADAQLRGRHRRRSLGRVRPSLPYPRPGRRDLPREEVFRHPRGRSKLPVDQ